jgi:hypothetical protein
MLRRLLVVLMLATGLAACASREIGQPFEPDARSRLKVNASTRREAQNALGPPVSVSPTGQGGETWTYEHTKLSAVEYPVPFVRGAIPRQSPHTVLTLRFRFGILVDCAYFHETYRRNGPVLVPADTKQESCAQ